MSYIDKYFPELDNSVKKKLLRLPELYKNWNDQINVISRKDTENIETNHILHSLAIAKFISFKPGSIILDVGTGGGFPGIPLAILFPESEFVLCDSIGKKIKVVNDIAQQLKLNNVKGVHSRAEQIDEKFDFIVSRAVTKMVPFLEWIDGKIKPKSNHPIKNGVIYLKGGDLKEELAPIDNNLIIRDLSIFFDEEFFETKKIVYVEV